MKASATMVDKTQRFIFGLFACLLALFCLGSVASSAYAEEPEPYAYAYWYEAEGTVVISTSVPDPQYYGTTDKKANLVPYSDEGSATRSVAGSLNGQLGVNAGDVRIVDIAEEIALPENGTHLFSGLYNMTTLKNASNLKTSAVKSMRSMFESDESLVQLDVSGWNTSSVTTFESMFNECNSLKAVGVHSWNTAKATSMESLFKGCESLTSLDLSRWNISAVKNMSSMFCECKSMSSLNLSNWKTSVLTSTTSMFEGMNKCASISGIGNLNVSKVTNMAFMFQNCASLSSLNLSSWNTASLTDMGSMFEGCKNLKELNLSGFNTSKCSADSPNIGLPHKSMGNVLKGCNNLTKVTLGKNFVFVKELGTSKSQMVFPNPSGKGYWYNASLQPYAADAIPSATAAVYTYHATPLVNISNVTVASISQQAYTGKAVCPTVKLTYGGKTLVQETDYTLTYKNNVNIGLGTVVIKGKGNYNGQTSVTFSIDRTNLSKAIITVPKQVYTGSALKPKPTVRINGTNLVSGTDYLITYSNNTNAGKGTIKVTGKGFYTGSKTINFEIIGKPLTSATHKANNATYTGYAIASTPTVKIDGKTLRSGTDFTVTYSNNKAAGTAKYTIKGKGNYSGELKGTFKIAGLPYSKVKIGGTWKNTSSGRSFTFDAKTKEATGKSYPSNTFLTISGKKYYFNSKGIAQTGLKTISGKKYYFNSSGVMLTGWQKINGKKYYFATSGVMQTGKKTIGSSTYYFNSSGEMVTGWNKEGSYWYYYNSNGVMQKSKWIGNYYVSKDGKMATNTWIGKYHVNEQGRWDKTKK